MPHCDSWPTTGIRRAAERFDPHRESGGGWKLRWGEAGITQGTQSPTLRTRTHS